MRLPPEPPLKPEHILRPLISIVFCLAVFVGLFWATVQRIKAEACDKRAIDEIWDESRSVAARLAQTECSYGAGVDRNYYETSIYWGYQNREAVVFSEETYRPYLRWGSSRSLVIILKDPAYIIKSTKNLEGISIGYDLVGRANLKTVADEINGIASGHADDKFKSNTDMIVLDRLRKFLAWGLAHT